MPDPMLINECPDCGGVGDGDLAITHAASCDEPASAEIRLFREEDVIRLYNTIANLVDQTGVGRETVVASTPALKATLRAFPAPEEWKR